MSVSYWIDPPGEVGLWCLCSAAGDVVLSVDLRCARSDGVEERCGVHVPLSVEAIEAVERNVLSAGERGVGSFSFCAALRFCVELCSFGAKDCGCGLRETGVFCACGAVEVRLSCRVKAM